MLCGALQAQTRDPIAPFFAGSSAQHLLVDTPTPMPHPLDVLVQAPRASSDLHCVLLAARAEAVQNPSLHALPPLAVSSSHQCPSRTIRSSVAYTHPFASHSTSPLDASHSRRCAGALALGRDVVTAKALMFLGTIVQRCLYALQLATSSPLPALIILRTTNSEPSSIDMGVSTYPM
ncbi:hypothetical protein BJ912DRAFT_1066103 [Pholiota molesta]|nr:hypothetical protein BJ912DRAFT_1066103 [Pholiota molesta]